MNAQSKPGKFLPWLDVIAMSAWGFLLLKYWISGQLNLLIHPNYFWLVLVAGIVLLIGAGFKILQLFSPNISEPNTNPSVEHVTLFSPSWSSGLLIAIAILAFIIPPKVLASQTALQRGITESLPLSRLEAKSFRSSVKPENRTLIDWVRTLNAYPEPDVYTGQKVNVKGFVVHSDKLPDNYLLISRFVLTCCAVDAYPVGLPVKLSTTRGDYKPDTWLEIQGEMMTELLPIDTSNMQKASEGERQLVIAANSLKTIPTPANPYEYHDK